MMGVEIYSSGRHATMAHGQATLTNKPTASGTTYHRIVAHWLMSARYRTTTSVTCFAVIAMENCIVFGIEAEIG